MAQERDLARLIEVGIALSAETNLSRLLDKILATARELTDADAGTLYTLSENRLHFKILHNDTLNVRQGVGPDTPLPLEPLRLDRSSAAGYAAVTGGAVNIPDVYESADFDFSGPRKHDRLTGYRTRSMLVVPLRNREKETVGVLQLLNAKHPRTGRVTAFSSRAEELAAAFASQAAVAITNARLLEEVQSLFDALVRVLAVAVDAKSPYTGSHVQRVALLNRMLAEAVDASGAPPFSEVRFGPDELETIRLAGWLHDVGKVTTPSWIMDKSTKLQTVFDRIGLLQCRFELIGALLENEGLRALLERRKVSRGAIEKSPEMAAARARAAEAEAEWKILARINEPAEAMDEKLEESLERIAAKTYRRDGIELPYLTADEARNLSVRRGSLTPAEVGIMRDHVKVTAQILDEVPFAASRRWKNVPLYARQHHEKLNGEGYPEGLSAEAIPLPSRILAVADFYEALSAKDRPYKKPMSRETIYGILRAASSRGELDGDVVELAINGGIFEQFEKMSGQPSIRPAQPPSRKNPRQSSGRRR
jgi:HD-GYP domain-containing protein (c-di-GMP phosphodiesterase class II)